MKIAAAVIVVLCGYFAGSAFSSIKKERYRLTVQSLSLLNNLRRGIALSNRNIVDIIVSSGMTEKFNSYFPLSVRFDMQSSWKEAVMSIGLPAEACGIMLEAGRGLGSLSRGEQLSRLDPCIARMNEICGAMKNEEDKRSGSYKALGALFAALAVIVIL